MFSNTNRERQYDHLPNIVLPLSHKSCKLRSPSSVSAPVQPLPQRLDWTEICWNWRPNQHPNSFAELFKPFMRVCLCVKLHYPAKRDYRHQGGVCRNNIHTDGRTHLFSVGHWPEHHSASDQLSVLCATGIVYFLVKQCTCARMRIRFSIISCFISGAKGVCVSSHGHGYPSSSRI